MARFSDDALKELQRLWSVQSVAQRQLSALSRTSDLAQQLRISANALTTAAAVDTLSRSTRVFAELQARGLDVSSLATAPDLSGIIKAAGHVSAASLLATRLDETLSYLNRGLRPAANAALLASIERFRTGEFKTTADKLLELGWWPPADWSYQSVLEAVDVGETRGRRYLDRWMCEQFTSARGRDLRLLVTGLMDQPEFRMRGPIIREAMSGHLAGRWKSSIPTLLPLIEGIAIEVFPMPAAKNPATVIRKVRLDPMAGTVNRLFTEALLTTLSAFWAFVDFDTVPPTSRQLNRHTVLHGRTVRYGTQANSLRVFLALDALHNEVKVHRRSVAA